MKPHSTNTRIFSRNIRAARTTMKSYGGSMRSRTASMVDSFSASSGVICRSTPSMSETAKMYGKIVANGPYSEVAPHAQLQAGAAREKDKDYDAAVKAYETAADRYNNQPVIAADAMYRWAIAYEKQATKAEYDQGKAGQAIAAYTDFITLFPDDKRVADAQNAIVMLKAEQVRGSFIVAQFYEKSRTLSATQRRNGAIVYYNEVLQLNPNSPYAAQARQRIEALRPQLQNPPAS